jgi:surfactin synthase thioesterase subunit
MARINNSSDWFTDFGQSHNKAARIFAFPYSGAGTVVYQSWVKEFAQKDISLLGVQLPGRENRYKETLMTDLRTLINQLTDEIQPLTDKPFVFFGHSLGGLIAFELCRELRRRNQSLPAHLFISAFRTPDMPNPNPELHNLNDQQLIQKIREYGGTPESILSSVELMALFTPILKADFKLFETYEHQREAPLACPVTTFCGRADNIVKPEYMKNWSQQSASLVKHHLLPGAHFFLDQCKQAILEQITAALEVPHK